MFGWLTDRYKIARANQRTQLRSTEILESYLDRIAGLDNVYVDSDRLEWERQINQHFDPSSPATAMRLGVARRAARRLLKSNAHAKNIVKQIVNFTVGPGFGVQIADDAAHARWDKWVLANDWGRRVRGIVRRIPRDGEAILRRFGSNNEPLVRIVEPESLFTPPDLVSCPYVIDGVEVASDPIDVESVQAYWIKEPNGDHVRVEADEIYHIRDPDSDTGSVRGWPLLYEAQRDLDAYEEFIQYRAILNKVRAMFAFIRRHKGATKAQVQSFVSNIKDGSLGNARTGNKSLPYVHTIPGVGLDTTDNIEYEFPRSNIDSHGAAEDGRALRLLIACDFSFPEYLVTCDASNANYASTLVAEAPGIRAMMAWQNFTGHELAGLIRWVLGIEDLPVQFSWPPMVMRDNLKEAQANQIRHNAGVLSTQTWQERDGLDPEQEAERMASMGGPMED